MRGSKRGLEECKGEGLEFVVTWHRFVFRSSKLSFQLVSPPRKEKERRDETYSFGSDGRNDSLERFTLFVKVLRESGRAEFLDPGLSLLKFLVQRLLVRCVDLSSQSGVVGQLRFDRVDDCIAAKSVSG